MSPNFRIAYRFLTAKKRSMLMSLSCITLGVGLFVVTQATTSGFQDLFIKTVLGTDGAMRIEDKEQDTLSSIPTSYGGPDIKGQGKKLVEGIDNPGLLIQTLKTFPNVRAISPVLRGSVTIRSSFKDDAVQVFGINLEDHMKVSDLASQIVLGNLDTFKVTPNGALVGRELADRLHLQVGDSFQCLTISNPDQPRRYKVSAIYETGVSDVDKVRVYIHMSEARSLFQKPTGVTYLQVDLFDRDRAPEEAEHIEAVINYSAKAWQVRERVWLEVFRALRVSTAMTVSIFTLIAGLAMFNTLAMIVMEKTKDIAILRSMGYTRSDITRIFLWQAIIVLLIGSAAGSAIGAGVTFGVSKMPLNINGIFKTETFVVAWSIWHYVEAVGLSIVMVMVASLIPARRAARLEPGDIIRGTAS